MRYEIVRGNLRTQLGEGPLWSERMFVTSAACESPGGPQDGAVFEVDPQTRGVTVGRFAG